MDAGGEGTPFILLEQAGSVVSGETLVRIKIMIFGSMIKPTVSKVWGKKKTTARMYNTEKYNSTKKKKILQLLHRETMHGVMHPYTITSSTRRDKVKDKTSTIIGEK